MNYKKRVLTLLLYSAPILSIMYGTLDHLGYIDRLFKIGELEKAVQRLESGIGYPRSFIFNDSLDKTEFDLLIKLIVNNTDNDSISIRIKNGNLHH